MASSPEKIVTNDDLARKVETSHEWIVQRTGIEQRHLAKEGETTADLAEQASRRALHHAGMGPEDLDLIVLATATPDLTFPSTASMLQARLGMHNGAAFDVGAVCSGFLYALATADNFLKTAQARTALVVGAETFSRILDWTDRTTCVLFGDGAGAVVLKAVPEEEAGETGLLKTVLRSDGRYTDCLYVDGGPSRTQSVGHLRMEGREVFRHAVEDITNIIKQTAEKAQTPVESIDWFIPHQANQRILDAVAKKLAIAPEKIVSTLAQHANTSAASVPLALHAALEDGRLKKRGSHHDGGFWGAVSHGGPHWHAIRQRDRKIFP